MATPTVTREYYNQMEDAAIKLSGKNPKLYTEDMRRTDPDIRAMRERWGMEQEPSTEMDSGGKSSLATGGLQVAQGRAKLGALEAARRQSENEGYVWTIADREAWEKAYDAGEAERSRQLTTSPYDDKTVEASTVPIESQRVRTAPAVADSFKRQTSNPIPAQRQQVEYKPPATIEGRAALNAFKALDGYLLKNNQTYASNPEKRAEILQSEVDRLSSTLSGKGKVIGPTAEELEATADPLIEGGAFSRKVTKGNIPDLDEGQMLFLNTLRGSMIDQKTKELLAQGNKNAGVEATQWVDQQLGPRQEWMSPEGKKRLLAQAPQFEGFAGIGVTRYPSGTTVESTPAYALRVISGPSNFVAGATTSILADALPEFAKQRRQSEMTPTAAVPGEVSGYRLVKEPNAVQSAFIDEEAGVPNAFGRALIRGADSIAKNRGFAEEVYDLTDTFSDNEYLKKAGFVTGLVGDIAMPIVPGAGGLKAGAKTLANAGDLAKVLKGTEGFADTAKAVAKDSDLLVEGAKLAGRELIDDGFVLKNLARITGNAVEAGDVRLVAANMARDTIKRELAAENVVNLGMRENQVALRELQATIGVDDPLYKQALRVAEQGEGEVFKMLNNLPSRIPTDLADELADGLKVISDYDKLGSAALKGAKTSYEDLVRWTRTAIDASPQLKALVKDVRGFDNILRTVNGKLLGKRMLYEAMVADKAAQRAARVINTGPGALYLLTGKTAVASKKAAQKIFDAAKETPVGKALATGALEPESLKTASGSKKVISGLPTTSKISLPLEARKVLRGYVDELSRTSRFDQKTLTNISDEIDSGLISTQTARALMNLQIDDVARQLYKGKIVALGDSAIRNLPKTVRNELLTPTVMRRGVVQRGLAFLRDNYLSDMPKLGEAIKGSTAYRASRLSIPAQKVLGDIVQEMAAMDKTLAAKIKMIVDDVPGVRAAYELPEGAKLTEREAMLALVFRHPTRPLVEEGTWADMARQENRRTEAFAFIGWADLVTKNLTDIALHGKPTKEKLADLVGGTIKGGDPVDLTAILNDSKNTVFKRRLEELSQRFSQDLSLTNLDGTVQQIANYLDELSSLVKEENISIKVFPKKKMEQLLTALYFQIEKGKIRDYHLGKLVDELGVKINPNLLKPLKDIAQRIESTKGFNNINYGAKTISAEKLADDLVKARIAHVVRVNTGLAEDTLDDFLDVLAERSSLLREAWEKIYGDIDKPIAGMTMKEVADYEKAHTLLNTVDDLAKDILDNSGLGRITIEEHLNLIDGVVKGEKTYDELALSTKDYETLKGLIDSSYDAEKFRTALKDLTNDSRYWTAFQNAISTLKAGQYAMMLSFRPRFHGMNFLTAPFIMASTLGGEVTASAMRRFNKGAALSRYVNEPLGSAGKLSDVLERGKVAVTTPAGISYTWRDLADIARQNGILRTITSTDVGREVINKNAQMLTEGLIADLKAGKRPALGKILGSPLNIARWLRDQANSFAEWSDGAFRMSVLIDSLEQGEDVSQAVQKARAALYDYGKLTDWEKQNISDWFAFYSFTRASVANTLYNAINHPSRLARQIKLTKGMNLYGDSEEKPRSVFYEPEYLRSRPLMAIYNGIDKERYAEYAPGLPPVDTIILLAKILSPVVEEPISGYKEDGIVGGGIGAIKGVGKGIGALLGGLPERANPALKALFGWDEQTEKMVLEQGYIDPRHVAWIKALGGWDKFESVVGIPSQRPARPGETSWNGQVYSFKNQRGEVDEKAAKQYLAILRLGVSSLMGSDTIIKDFAPLVARWDEEIDAPWNYTDEELEQLKAKGINPDKRGIDLTTNLWEQLGVVTQSKLPTALETATQKTEQETTRLKNLRPDSKTKSN